MAVCQKKNMHKMPFKAGHLWQLNKQFKIIITKKLQANTVEIYRLQ